MGHSYQKHGKILVITLLVNILLVATHLGEFWPFSIFPMFSQAGKPWSRGLVERVEDPGDPDLWRSKPLESVEKRVLPLRKYGIHEIDFANYISKTHIWDPARIHGLRTTFQIDKYPGEMWLATRVTGKLNPDGSIAIQTIPMLLYTADSTLKNPEFFPD